MKRGYVVNAKSVPIYRFGDKFADRQAHARVMAVLAIAREREQTIPFATMQGVFSQFGAGHPLSIYEPGVIYVRGIVVKDILTDLERAGVVAIGPFGSSVGPRFDEVAIDWGDEFRALVEVARQEFDKLRTYTIWSRHFDS